MGYWSLRLTYVSCHRLDLGVMRPRPCEKIKLVFLIQFFKTSLNVPCGSFWVGHMYQSKPSKMDVGD
jgi:hypothetical protein